MAENYTIVFSDKCSVDSSIKFPNYKVDAPDNVATVQNDSVKSPDDMTTKKTREEIKAHQMPL